MVLGVIDVSAIISLMIQHNGGEPEKINRMMKIYSFARVIALEEGVADSGIEIIEAAAVLCELGSGNSESAAYADMLLLNLGYERKLIERVHKLILTAGEYTRMDNVHQQIIAEAKFLVSASELRLDKETLCEELRHNFRTDCGRRYLCSIFSVGNRISGDNNNLGGNENA